MQGLDDVGRMGCSSLATNSATNQNIHFATVNISLMHFIQNIQFPMNPFCAKTLKIT
jgi:hypothetical protein